MKDELKANRVNIDDLSIMLRKQNTSSIKDILYAETQNDSTLFIDKNYS